MQVTGKFFMHFGGYLLIFALLLSEEGRAESQYQLTLLESSVLADPSLEWRMQDLDAKREQSVEVLEWVDGRHAEWSEDISDLGRYLDGLMGAVEKVQDKNESYLKIDLDLYHSKFGGTEFDPRIRFRLDLPVLKEKFRLVFETEPDQTKALSERILDSFPSAQNSATNDSIYASFRYWLEADKWLSLSFDSGIRIRFRPDIFSRFRAVRNWTITEYWLFRLSQEIFWFESRGLGTQTQLDFDRPFRKRFLFRKTLALDWSERDARYDLLNQFSIFHNYDEGKALQYAIGMQSDYESSQALANNYFVHFTFRSRLYKDWLFYQFNTGIEYPKEYQFRPNPFVSFRLEILFAADAEKKLRAALY